jgi:hypothetical protein
MSNPLELKFIQAGDLKFSLPGLRVSVKFSGIMQDFIR